MEIVSNDVVDVLEEVKQNAKNSDDSMDIEI